MRLSTHHRIPFWKTMSAVASLLVSLVMVSTTVVAFTTFNGGDKDCDHKCPKDKAPFFREKLLSDPSATIFSSNGCGSSGVKIVVDDNLTPCCHVHDACYSICGVSRKFCDDEFSKCLNAVDCGKGQHPNNNNGCRGNANMLSSGVQMFGCSAFRAAQMDACECFDSKQRDAALQPLLQHLYAKAGFVKSEEEMAVVATRARKDVPKTIFQILQKYNSSVIVYEGENQAQQQQRRVPPTADEL